ncbi:MAG: hypothetical protein ABIN67_09940 [Ferruginibacter sp.]
MTKRSLYNLICKSKIAVALPGSPHSELMIVRFVVTRGLQLIVTTLGDLANDYFFTNNNIAFVIGNDDNGTILYVGRIKK